MEKRQRIVWIDDEIGTSILEPYVDEFDDNEIDVVKVDNVDGVIPRLKEELQQSLSAIIVDIIMPPGKCDFNETSGGLRTGIVVLKEILNDDSFKNVTKIVVTNVDDEKVRDFCKGYGIQCLKKDEYFSDSLVERIMSLI